MARMVNEVRLETATARNRLAPRGRPYFRAIGEGLHLGYRRGATDGRWVARVYRGGGDYTLERIGLADDRSDADGEQVLNFWQAEAAARRLQAVLLNRDTAKRGYRVADALADYFDALDAEGRASAYARSRMAIHVPEKLAAMPVDKIKSKMLQSWLADMAAGAGYARGTDGKAKPRASEEADQEGDRLRARRASANRTFAIMKAALNLAFREGRAASDVEWRRVRPFRQVTLARAQWLTVAEAQRLVNAAAEPGFRALLQAALQTGCRYGELCRLRVRDFNADAATLAIGRSKSGAIRHVVLTDEGAALFRALVPGRRGHDYILRNLARQARSAAAGLADPGDWRPSEQSRPMLEAARRAGLDPAPSFHALRHTWASLAVMAGVPLMVVARNLGHADTRMVERHYGHLADGYIHRAIRESAPRFGHVHGGNVVGLR